MRRRSTGHGFWLSLLINMLFRMEWFLIAAVLFGLHLWINIPLWLTFVALGIWVLYPLIITLFFGWANRVSSQPAPKQENKNPYSVGNSNLNRINNSPDKMMANEDHMCPCCGKYKFDEIGKYEICPICNWEDDPVQRVNPNYTGGANKMSLSQAREIYRKEKAGV